MGVPIIKGDFLSHSFEQSFDAVTFWAVMEHLFEPQRFLQKARSILKPGGLCFILVPNMKSLAIKLTGSKYRYIFARTLELFHAGNPAEICGRRILYYGFEIHPLQSAGDLEGFSRRANAKFRAQNVLNSLSARQPTKNPVDAPVKNGLSGCGGSAGEDHAGRQFDNCWCARNNKSWQLIVMVLPRPVFMAMMKGGCFIRPHQNRRAA